MTTEVVRIASIDSARPDRADRIELVLDTGEAIRLHQRRLLGGELAPGGVLSAGLLARRREQAAFDAAEHRALRLIARRARSRAELRERCAGWGLSEALADELVERLERIGAIDERALRASIVRHRHGAGHGRLRIEADMHRLGITDPDDADGVDPEGEVARARREVERRFGVLPTAPADTRRAAAHLARRGFDAEAVADALRIVDA
jgi:regulatory protein